MVVISIYIYIYIIYIYIYIYIEVLNSSQSSSTWWEICDLPVKSHLMQCTVTHEELFIGCGYGTDNKVHTAKLSAVKEPLNVDGDSESSVSPESFWHSLPQTPLWWEWFSFCKQLSSYCGWS